MAFTWPTKAELLDRFLAWYRMFLPNATTAQGSDAWKEGQAVSGVGGILMSRARAIYNDIFVTTASEDALTIHGEVQLPEDKRRIDAGGTTAGEIHVTGTATTIPINTEYVHDDGTRYKTSESIVAGDWAGGAVDVEVISITTGAISNKGVGDTLTIVSPIAGVDDEATVSVALSGARDQETVEEYRARILSWLRNPPGGGNWAHYKNFSEGVGGCVKAYVYPLYRALGTVDVVVMGPGVSDDHPTGDRFSAAAATVLAYLDAEMRPATADLSVIVPTEQAENVDVSITPAPGYEPDYTTDFTVTGIAGDFVTITVTANPTAIIADGDRIHLNVRVGTVWTPCVRIVDHTTAAPNTIVVTEALPSTTHDPVANGLKPAGAGTEDQINAILAVFDDLTPGDYASTRRPVVGPEDPTDLTLFALMGKLYDLSSVTNAAITTPAADVVPTGVKWLIRNGKIKITYV